MVFQHNFESKYTTAFARIMLTYDTIDVIMALMLRQVVAFSFTFTVGTKKTSAQNEPFHRKGPSPEPCIRRNSNPLTRRKRNYQEEKAR